MFSYKFLIQFLAILIAVVILNESMSFIQVCNVLINIFFAYRFNKLGLVSEKKLATLEQKCHDLEKQMRNLTQKQDNCMLDKMNDYRHLCNLLFQQNGKMLDLSPSSDTYSNLSNLNVTQSA